MALVTKVPMRHRSRPNLTLKINLFAARFLDLIFNQFWIEVGSLLGTKINGNRLSTGLKHINYNSPSAHRAEKRFYTKPSLPHGSI